MATDDLEQQAAEAKREIVENHDLEADANEAHELIDEAVALWGDLDHAGRISRIRKAHAILEETLSANRAKMDLNEPNEMSCPDCGGTEFASEDIGAGKSREYCTNCDWTLGV